LCPGAANVVALLHRSLSQKSQYPETLLTVDNLVQELGLELAAGADRAENAVRWVHISEEDDPTPWLNGGELLLTTGATLRTAASQRRFLARLAEHDLAGLGFGVVDAAGRPPRALVEEADKLGFPLFEVPPSMPFQTVTKAAMVRLVNDRYDVLRRGVAVQQWLGHLALEERGLDGIAAAISAAVGGSVLIAGAGGRPIARHDPTGAVDAEIIAALGVELAAREEARPFILAHPALPAGAYARPVLSPRGTRAQAWIVVATDDGRLDELVRLVVQQAVAIVGLELMHRNVASDTERRLTASLVGDAFAGRTDPADLGRRLAAFGIAGEVAVATFTAAGPAAERALKSALAAIDVAAAVSTQEVDGRELLCAIAEVGERDPIEVADEARLRLSEEAGPGPDTAEVLAGVSRARPAADLWRTFQEASWALGTVEHKRGLGEETGPVGSWHDLGVESLLLSVGDEDVLHLYCDRLLGPVLASDSVYSAELLRSLELFILHNGQWERAARELHCHRHTLRYRMRKVEEMTGRDLSKATDRIEFWLALRARELAARSAPRPGRAPLPAPAARPGRAPLPASEGGERPAAGGGRVDRAPVGGDGDPVGPAQGGAGGAAARGPSRRDAPGDPQRAGSGPQVDDRVGLLGGQV
jgi:purine catabolism regulator